MSLRNLTPHAISIVLPDGSRVIIPSDPEGPARILVRSVPVGEILHDEVSIPVMSSVLGAPIGLPDADLVCPGCGANVVLGGHTVACNQDPCNCAKWSCPCGADEAKKWPVAPIVKTWLLVSAIVRTARPQRPDLVSPGELVRGPDGQPVGCKGVAR